MRRLLSHILAAIAGLWLSAVIVPGVYVQVLPTSRFFSFHITSLWQIYLLIGIVLGLLFHFAKPILNVITLPLRIITLGLFGFLISMALVWITTVLFQEFQAPWLWPLLWTTAIMYLANIIIGKIVSIGKND